MSTPKAIFAGLTLIAALCSGFTLGLTAPAWAGFDEGVAAYQRGDLRQPFASFAPSPSRETPKLNNISASCTLVH